MKIIILLFIFILLITECISLKYRDICYPKEGENFECYGIYKYNCGDFVCIKDEYNCQLLSLFSGLKGVHKIKYEIFMAKIRKCPEPPKYKWIPNNVCLNAKTCMKYKVTIWSMQMVPIECKCSGKYNFKCNNDYCGLDERACDIPKKKKFEIKKC